MKEVNSAFCWFGIPNGNATTAEVVKDRNPEGRGETKKAGVK
jgi:hypothetical protein